MGTPVTGVVSRFVQILEARRLLGTRRLLPQPVRKLE